MLEFDKIYLGECLDLMQHIEDKSIDFILCDLPYGSTACSWDIVIPLDKLWESYKRILKDNGTIALTSTQPFTSVLVASNLEMYNKEILKILSNILDFYLLLYYNKVKEIIDETFGVGKETRNSLYNRLENV